MSEENNKDQITGDRQSSFAGTNPNKYGDPKSADEQDNPITDQEAQNVTDGGERLEGDAAEAARRKAHGGSRSGQ